MAVTNSKWMGGSKWVMCSRYGSKKSNSGTVRGRTRYSCGTERSYLGGIMHELHQGLIGRVGKERATNWWRVWQ
jgi:hypothetical protein